MSPRRHGRGRGAGGVAAGGAGGGAVAGPGVAPGPGGAPGVAPVAPDSDSPQPPMDRVVPDSAVAPAPLIAPSTNGVRPSGSGNRQSGPRPNGQGGLRPNSQSPRRQPAQALPVLPVQPQPVDGDEPAGPKAGCTLAQMRRFIKSRPYVPVHELRRRFLIEGIEDEVSPVTIDKGKLFVGLPEREAGFLGELIKSGEVGCELLLDPTSPAVIGVFPMRPVARQ